MLVTLCSCSYAPSTRFMSKAQVRQLAKEFDDPQAELTINYEVNNKAVEVKITYKLLLTQAPLATIRFIQLVNDGFYDDTLLDSYNSNYKYALFGRYLYKESKVQGAGEMEYYQNPCDVTFKGEFKSNRYKQPQEGYAQFKMMSLAMYHEDWTEDNNTFDSANGYVIMALSSKTLNSDNYAVFADMISATVKYADGEESAPFTNFPSDIHTQLTQSSTISRDVYEDDSEVNSSKVSIKSPNFIVHIRMLGNYDWSKLPSIGK